MSARTFRRCGRGFSLIELMIAAVILVMGVVSVMSLVLFALSASYASRIESAALRLSQQKLEELRSLPIDDVKLLGPGSLLDSQRKIDFGTAADPAYSVAETLILNWTKNTSLHFETRWNVAPQGAKKIIIVATRQTDGSFYDFKPVNLRLLKAP